MSTAHLPPPTTDPILLLLLQWLDLNECWVDPRIRIAPDPAHPERGYGVRALADIPYGAAVSKTPKTAILSIRSCALSDKLYPLVKNIDPNIGLAVALLSEQLLGKQSRFWGYLQSFPRGGADIALFWRWKGEEGEEAMRWLQGTEVGWIMRGSLLKDLERVYEKAIRPALAEYHPTLEQFRQAYSLVSSRAFQVDFWHGVGLVPVADAFNHSEENNVFMETDFAVCTQCGSLGPCVHPTHTPRHSSPWDEPMTCDMVAYSPIKKGEEVFNSYDEKGFSNAQLLVHYGFLMEGNGEDRIRWHGREGVEEVLARERGDVGKSKEEEGKRSAAVKKAARQYRDEMEDLECLVTPGESREVQDEQPDVDDDDDDDDEYYIDASGRLSQTLFLHLFARNVPTPAIRDLPTLLGSVLSALGGEKGWQKKPMVAEIMRGIERDVARLCQQKKAAMYKPELGTDALAAMLDTNLGTRVKLAISYALTERMILETCESWWGHLTTND